MSTHSHSGTLTLNSKNSGLIKSSRNQVSGGFSQSAMALVNKNRKDKKVIMSTFAKLSTNTQAALYED